MSVVKINAITRGERGGKSARGAVRQPRKTRWRIWKDSRDSSLLRPVEGEDRYFVYTRWRSEEDFQRWVNSDEFRKGHARSEGDGPIATHATPAFV